MTTGRSPLAENKIIDFCDECGEPVWETRYGTDWQMTYRPGARLRVDLVYEGVDLG